MSRFMTGHHVSKMVLSLFYHADSNIFIFIVSYKYASRVPLIQKDHNISIRFIGNIVTWEENDERYLCKGNYRISCMTSFERYYVIPTYNRLLLRHN